MKNRVEILRQSGCLDFTEKAAERELREIERERPDFAALLTDEARSCLVRNCAKRLELIYIQALDQELQESVTERDPVSAMLGRPDTALEEQQAGALFQSANGQMEAFLHERYPLAADYAGHSLRNFRASWIEFFDALSACREEISLRLLDGRAFTKIERFSDFGGDQHRHGRAVVGVWTDGGVFYYKPHDCTLDIVYREIVERWFSDSTTAARVVQVNKVAFVSQLCRTPVDSEGGIADYYYHFGILTALLHGLGSFDMHLENIMSCGDKPAVIDVETLISPSLEKQEKNKQLEASAHALGHTVYRIGILPVRMYGKPLFSPLYSEREGAACLPILEGDHRTVTGYEERYLAGFREGYGRMLAHREEIRALLRERGDAAVRCLMRNTFFYGLIRGKLYRPETLQSEEKREAVLDLLTVPFKQIGAEVFREEVAHEAACLRIGDIPYFCTRADRTDLCGDDPEQIIKAGYYSDSPLNMTGKNLDWLSEEELRYEEDIIRVAFAHAPLDAPKKTEAAPIADAPAERGNVRSMIIHLFRALQADAMRTPEGQKLWVSTAATLQGIRPFSLIGSYAEVGAFCAAILRKDALAGIHGEAMEMAKSCVQSIYKGLAAYVELDREALAAAPQLPMGLYDGWGGVLWGLAAMTEAKIPKAQEATKRTLELLMRYVDFWRTDSSVAEGLAGLMLGLDALPVAPPEAEACMRLCAGRLLEADVPGIPDAPKGAAGIAAALAAAYRRLGDGRCAEKAAAILSQVRRDYREDLRGWPDSAVKIRWMAERGRQAAGIALAADYAAGRVPDSGEAEALRETALLSLLDEKELGRYDTLNQGNALTVVCLIRNGNAERAGRVLEAMRQRAGQEGSYAVTAPGIRSFFDPALWLGSLGVGLAATEYLRMTDKG